MGLLMSDEAEARIAAAEQRATAAELRALRTGIANTHGISQADADLLLTATDEQTLTLQAQRFSELNGTGRTRNVAPREGSTRESGKNIDPEMREFVGQLFG
jgi:hypothetical protein